VISCDTNILYAACDAASKEHAAARQWLSGQVQNPEFVLCEQVLMELYCLLRNPAVAKPPLPAAEAARVVSILRTNPVWRIVDVPAGSRELMNQVWAAASERSFAYRRIFDLRLAFTLRHHGVTTFATRNVRDFQACGFSRVIDPAAGAVNR